MIIRILAMDGDKISGSCNADTESREDGLMALEFVMNHLERGRVIVGLDQETGPEYVRVNLRRIMPIRFDHLEAPGAR